MGVNLTNENADEFLTSQIDGENKDADTMHKVNEMIAHDGNLMKKYKSELLTKQLFSSRLKNIDVPNATYMKVMGSIDILINNTVNHEEKELHPLQTSESFFRYLINVLASPLRIGHAAVPRYAVGLVIILIIAGIGFLAAKKDSSPLNPFIANGTEKSVMVQAVNNFHKILKGEIKPQLQSNDANEVSNFVNKNVSFKVFVPLIENYELAGVICNEYEGQKLVHLVYTSGDEVIYIYETDANSIHPQRLELPDAVHKDIIKDNYYMCDQVDHHNCTMTLWYAGNVLCASVTTMPKHKMISTFTRFNK
jgi:hypothetical protein